MAVKSTDIAEFLENFTESTLVYDGFEDAFLGYAERCASPGVAIYSFTKMVEVLVERDGMSEEDAEEYLHFNVLGGWLGEKTPYVLFDFRRVP